MSKGRNRINPAPDPEREWYDLHKGKKIRVYADLLGEHYLEGILVWVRTYFVGLGMDGKTDPSSVRPLNKAFIAGYQSLE